METVSFQNEYQIKKVQCSNDVKTIHILQMHRYFEIFMNMCSFIFVVMRSDKFFKRSDTGRTSTV